MALTARVLNTDATVNSFQVVGSSEFFPGETKTIVFRLHDTEQDLRYIPGATAVVSFTFSTVDGTLEKVASLNVDDRSIATVNLSSAETDEMVGGNVQIQVTDGASIMKGVAYNSMRKLLTDC